MSEPGEITGGEPRRRIRGAGGTSGGLWEFFLGLGLAGLGCFLLFNQVEVHTSFWRFGGLANSFGISLIPMILGVGILFFNGRSVVGWILAVAGLLFVVAGIVANMDIYFRPTTLFNTIIMLVLIAGGFGLIVRGLRPHGG